MRYNPEKLIELTRCLLPEDPSLEEEVRFSIQNPRVYLQYYRQKRSYWKGFRRPTSNLPWLALIDGLYDRNLIFEFYDFDLYAHPSSRKEPRHSIRAKRRAWVIKEGRWYAEYAWEREKHPSGALRELFIEVAAGYLDKLGYALCELVPSYQIFTLTIIERDIAEQCKEIARESGFGVLKILKCHAKPVFPSCRSHSIYDPLICLYRHQKGTIYCQNQRSGICPGDDAIRYIGTMCCHLNIHSCAQPRSWENSGRQGNCDPL